MTKKQRTLEEKLELDSDFIVERPVSKKLPPIVKVRFSEWVFSSFILLIMVFLFTELSREKFLNQVTVLTAKGFVDLGYRIFFLAVTMIVLGGIFSLFNWGKNWFRGQSLAKTQFSWTRRFLNLGMKIGIILIGYFILWILFLQFIVVIETYV
jgi:hypothetical protein